MCADLTMCSAIALRITVIGSAVSPGASAPAGAGAGAGCGSRALAGGGGGGASAGGGTAGWGSGAGGAATCASVLTLFVSALREATVAAVLFTAFGIAVVCTIGAIAAFTVEMLMAGAGMRATAAAERRYLELT